jgi:hypothetical protein
MNRRGLCKHRNMRVVRIRNFVARLAGCEKSSQLMLQRHLRRYAMSL